MAQHLFNCPEFIKQNIQFECSVNIEGTDCIFDIENVSIEESSSIVYTIEDYKKIVMDLLSRYYSTIPKHKPKKYILYINKNGGFMLDENDTAIYLISKDAFKNLDYSYCHIRDLDLSIEKKYISIIEYGTYVEKIKTDEKSYERKLRDDKFQVTYIDYEENELPNITLPKHIASINFKCTKFPKNLSIAYINHTDISDEIFMHIKGEINIRKYDVTLPLNIHNHNNVVILYNPEMNLNEVVKSWRKITGKYFNLSFAKYDDVLILPDFEHVTIECCQFKKLIIHPITFVTEIMCHGEIKGGFIRKIIDRAIY